MKFHPITLFTEVHTTLHKKDSRLAECSLDKVRLQSLVGDDMNHTSSHQCVASHLNE